MTKRSSRGFTSDVRDRGDGSGERERRRGPLRARGFCSRIRRRQHESIRRLAADTHCAADQQFETAGREGQMTRHYSDADGIWINAPSPGPCDVEDTGPLCDDAGNVCPRWKPEMQGRPDRLLVPLGQKPPRRAPEDF